MKKTDQFQAYVNGLLKDRLHKLDITELEKTGIKIYIYAIFERNYDLEKIYYEILDYLEENENLTPILDQVEMFYQTSLK